MRVVSQQRVSEPVAARRPREGFTLVEVVMAILILAVGVIGLAGATAQIVRQVTLADLTTERSVAFQTVIDQLQSLPYDSVGTGSDSVGIFAISWTSANQGAQSKIVTLVTVGPGISTGAFPTNNPQKADTFQFRVLRP